MLELFLPNFCYWIQMWLRTLPINYLFPEKLFFNVKMHTKKNHLLAQVISSDLTETLQMVFLTNLWKTFCHIKSGHLKVTHTTSDPWSHRNSLSAEQCELITTGRPCPFLTLPFLKSRQDIRVEWLSVASSLNAEILC